MLAYIDKDLRIKIVFIVFIVSLIFTLNSILNDSRIIEDPIERQIFIQKSKVVLDGMNVWTDSMDENVKEYQLLLKEDLEERIQINEEAERRYKILKNYYDEWSQRMKSYYEQNGFWRHN